MLPKNVLKNVGTTRNQPNTVASSNRTKEASQAIDDSDASVYSEHVDSKSDMNLDSIGQREMIEKNGIKTKSSKTKKRKGFNKESAKTVTVENPTPYSLSEKAPGLYSNLQTYISSRNTTSKKHSSANKDFKSSTHVLKSASPHTELNTSELRDKMDRSNESRSHSDDIVDSSILEYFIGDLRVGDILGT